MSEVLYADVKFKNRKGINAQADASTSNDSTYSEVRFSRAQGNDPSQDPTDNSASQPVGSKGGSKVASGRCDAVKVGLGLLCALLLAAVIALTVLYIQNKDLQKNLTDMQTKDKQTKEALRQNLTDYTDVLTKEKLQMILESNVLKKNLTDMQTKDKQTIEALQRNLTDYTDVQLQTKEKLQMMIHEKDVLKQSLTDMQTKDKQTIEALQRNLTDMQTKDRQIKEALQQDLTDSITKLTSCQAKPFSCPSCIQLQEGATCTKCAPGWESYGGKCYRFSSNKYTWDQSKNACTGQGANLVKIDSTDEQKFLHGKLKERMTKPEDKFWIGLTDSKIEGQWVWADDSPLTPTERFWNAGEPDNWKGEHNEGENCGRMGEKTGSDSPWFDAFCDKQHRYICEKQPDTGRFEKTCV